MSRLFPPGVDSLADCPFTLHDAILQAFHFLSFEELPLEDRPPRHIWLVNDEMEAWWKERDRIREESIKNPGAAQGSGDYEENDAAGDLIDYG